MPAKEPSRKAVKAVAALAKKHGLELKDSQLAGRHVGIDVLYAGGASLSRLIHENCAIHFAQAGSKGEWFAVLPASELVQLLELEMIYSAFQKKQFAKYKQKVNSDE
ncbi:MAG TPA: hypothetical protein VLA42_18245 [Verrucomicrobiae bacterium]|jgi:hypothetical protein|nr:hypothetical protein [Verrucomicrobiae bacterium]